MATANRRALDPVYSNGAALVANSVLASALGFAFWLVASRRFPPEALGWGAALVSAATLAALVGKAGFDAAIIRFVPGADPRAARRLLLHATAAAVVLTAAVVGVLLALAAHGGLDSLAGPLRSPWTAAGFLALACGTAAAWILDAFFIAEQAAVLTLARNAAFNVVKLFVVAAALAVPLAWGAGLLVSLLVALATAPLVFGRRAGGAASPSAGSVASYAARNYVLNVAEFLPGLLLPIVVLEAFGPATASRFYLAWTIATVGFLASKAIAQSAFAALVREGPPRAAVAKGVRLSALVLLPFALALLLAPHVLLALFGVAGPDAEALLRLLALSLVPLAASNLFLAYLKARRAGWELTLVPAATLVVLLATLPFALAAYGIAGAGIAWLAIQSACGLYAAARLFALLRSRTHHGRTTEPTPLGRRAHEG
jgi:O-antigen/teichoic acid export membrane protein